MPMSPQDGFELLKRWRSKRVRLGVLFAVGGGATFTMQAQISRLAPARMVLKGPQSNLALWLGGATYEYGPVTFFPMPVPPGIPVKGLSVMLKSGSWLFLCDVDGGGAETLKAAERALEAGSAEEDEEQKTSDDACVAR